MTKDFCITGVSDEVVAFCNYLFELQSAVNGAKAANSGVTATDLRPKLRNTLKYLNPADFASEPELIDAVKRRLALEQIKQQLTNAKVNSLDLAKAAQSTQTLRNDQQFSSNATASGTTSLVAKAGSSELISLAVDAGALTKTVNGATTTLTANADELFRVITKQEPDCIMNCDSNSGFQQWVLNPLNLSASFALAQTSNKTVDTNGQASGNTDTGITSATIPSGIGKLTAFTAKYEILNKFDPRSREFKDKWNKSVGNLKDVTAALDSAVVALYQQLQTDSAFKKAQEDDSYRDKLISAALNDPTGGKLVSAWKDVWTSATSTALGSPDVSSKVAAAVLAQQQFSSAWRQLVHDVAGDLFTFQYTLNKPANQPETHDFTGVYSHSWGDRGSLNVNGAISIYNGTLPTGAKYGRVHYGQASFDYENTMTKSSSSGYQTQYSLAAYWQYQPEPSILNIPAGTVVPGTGIPLPNGTQEFVGTAGSLWVGQGKITIRGPGGINIPVAGSWSNKTDLVEGHKLGAQVGISYNFSSIAKLF